MDSGRAIEHAVPPSYHISAHILPFFHFNLWFSCSFLCPLSSIFHLFSLFFPSVSFFLFSLIFFFPPILSFSPSVFLIFPQRCFCKCCSELLHAAASSDVGAMKKCMMIHMKAEVQEELEKVYERNKNHEVCLTKEHKRMEVRDRHTSRKPDNKSTQRQGINVVKL